jgi:hypothetical protein
VRIFKFQFHIAHFGNIFSTLKYAFLIIPDGNSFHTILFSWLPTSTVIAKGLSHCLPAERTADD